MVDSPYPAARPVSAPTHLAVYTDGGARGNPGPSAAAYVIKSNTGVLLAKGGEFLGTKTNNEAEYQGLILALAALPALSLPPRVSITFYSDSQLIVNQLKGSYKIKAAHLAALAAAVHQSLSTNHYSAIFVAIPREQNYQADALVNQILDHHQQNS